METLRGLAAAGARPLSEETLEAHGRNLEVPIYDRGALRPAIVHVGVGGFHRSHQAVYLDELAQRGIAAEWGVVGVSTRRPAMRDGLRPQDWLYSLIERGDEHEHARVIGVLRDVIFAPESREAAMASLASPEARIVTLTVTGGAYSTAPGGGGGDGIDAFALLAAGLDRRRASGAGPITILSCDNVASNGEATREATLRWAAARDAGLARWVESNVSFPSSVVDRITPNSTEGLRSEVARRFGLLDRRPVLAEPFTQWIVEDDFAAGRPPLEEVGVELVGDVAAHERLKKRLLNGAHTALAYVAYLAGFRRVDEAVRDDVMAAYLRELMLREVLPGLEVPTGIVAEDYVETLLDRFANPAIGDQLARLGERGSTKVPAYLLPSVEAALGAGTPIDLMSLAVAAWIRYLRGVDMDGERIRVVDPRRERLVMLARRGGSDPRSVLAERGIFGELGSSGELSVRVRHHLSMFERVGIEASVRAALAGDLVSSR